MLHDLPPELVLAIIWYLPLQSIWSLCLTSRYLNNLVEANKISVYHDAALYHNFVSSSNPSLRHIIKNRYGTLWSGVDQWSEFCRRSFQLERNWMGKGVSAARVLSEAGNDIHRIKIDEKEGICITSHQRGGITVTNLFPDQVLWSLPTFYVRRCAHCEYDNGFLIFDRPWQAKEVWRLAKDFSPEDVTSAAPDHMQIRASEYARERHQEHNERGHFRPWSLITLPESTWAFRFVYPMLITAGLHHAYLYNVCTRELVQVIDGITEQDMTIQYVDLSSRHVFVCHQDGVRIFSRESGLLVMEISHIHGTRCTQFDLHISELTLSKLVSPIVIALAQYEVPHRFVTDFVAVHVSADGRDLAVLCATHLMLIQGFERVIKGETSSEEATAVVTFPKSDGLYHAFEHGRVVVATTDGLYLFTLDGLYHAVHDAPALAASPFPGLCASYVTKLEQPGYDSHLSCLQLTDRRVFFTWHRCSLPSGLASGGAFGGNLLELDMNTDVAAHADEPDIVKMYVGCIDLSIMPKTESVVELVKSGGSLVDGTSH